MKPSDSRSHNRAAWNRLAKQQDRLAKPARDGDFCVPLGLANVKGDVKGNGWLGADVVGKRILCLAAGGGRHGPIYSAAGAVVTVVDFSPAMLELDRQVATERGLNLRTIEASMEDLTSLQNHEFDVVIHPVSTCYVPDVRPVYSEVARILRPGGIYISQHKQPTSLQTSLQADEQGYPIVFPYYSSQPLPVCTDSNLVREKGTLEYVHRWEQLLGAMCRSGLVIEDIGEPNHAKRDADPGSFAHRSQFVPPYIRVKARRIGSSPNFIT